MTISDEKHPTNSKVMPKIEQSKKLLSRKLLASTLMKKSVSLPSLRKKCPKCSKVCQNEKALHRHMKIHDCSTYFLCHKCKKRMSIQRDMCVHACVHDTPVQPHICTCGRQFSTRTVLEDHVYHHSSGRSPFTCSCGEVFNQQFIIKANKGTSSRTSVVGKIFGSLTLTRLSAKIPKYTNKYVKQSDKCKLETAVLPTTLPALKPKHGKWYVNKNKTKCTHSGLNYRKTITGRIKNNKIRKTRLDITGYRKKTINVKRRGGGFEL
jgi:uncharacterized Zn-finger protein